MSRDPRVPERLAQGSRVAVLYDELLGDSPDLLDGQIQRDSVVAALRKAGHAVQQVPCDLNLGAVAASLREMRPEVVFNLVESLGGSDRLMPLATLLLESLGLPFTGCSTAAIVSTNDKPAAKLRMSELGLPTAAFWMLNRPRASHGKSTAAESNAKAIARSTDDGSVDSGTLQPGEVVCSGCRADDSAEFPVQVIVKAISEHASVGLDDDSIVTVGGLAEMESLLRDSIVKRGTPSFAERFVDGREFNLSILDGQVLPVAEIDFAGWQPNKPRIVGYAAKWIETSAEFSGTPRTFDFPASDRRLLQRLTEISLACWESFRLAGAARVDFRVDADGRPWILEVNANPCLNPDGGFAAACERGGIDYDRMIDAIVRAALQAPGHLA